MNEKSRNRFFLSKALKRRKILRILVICLLAILMGAGESFSQAKCDGCSRRYIIDNIFSEAGELNEQSIIHHLNSTVITPCFHALSSGEEVPKEFKPMMHPRPHEYYFIVSYEEELKGEIKSRLQIDLFFNG